ncbi:MAG: metallophosphoesterase family protein [Acutalibacteraceae bacterium]|nr:metallophosphoesterase family protein [Acutalibacteraceae bacterium]
MFEFLKPKAKPIDFNVKLLIITDTHNCLEEEELNNINADVCLLLGDITDRDLSIIKQKVDIPIYGILGNHDSWTLYDKYNIENIHGKVIDIYGIKIAGLQGSIRYKLSDAPLYTDDESVEISKTIPYTDILISHDCPKYLYGKNNFAHSGLKGITEYCNKNRTPLNIHGHHHKRTLSKLKNGTVCIGCYGVQIIDTAKFANC